jgi:hypothetical protein
LRTQIASACGGRCVELGLVIVFVDHLFQMLGRKRARRLRWRSHRNKMASSGILVSRSIIAPVRAVVAGIITLRRVRKEAAVHPWLAVWIWSEAISRIVRDSILGVSNNGFAVQPFEAASRQIRLGDYFQTEIVTHPLPSNLLDRLADLYWTERESELPI